MDMLNLYQLEAEADAPLLRDGRPSYRSIPARRTNNVGQRTTKLDYYLYSTRLRGFNEWLLDTNDVDTDGAIAFSSDANIEPYNIHTDWTVWSDPLNEWLGEPLQVTCRDDAQGNAAGSSRGGLLRGGRWAVGMALPLLTLAAMRHSVRWHLQA